MRDRDPRQRLCVASRQPLVGGPRLCQAALAVDGDEGVQLRVETTDAIEVERRQFDARDPSAGEGLRNVGETVFDHSMTLGTR